LNFNYMYIIKIYQHLEMSYSLSDNILKPELPYLLQIKQLDSTARLDNNIFGSPIKCYRCDCKFHVQKYCILNKNKYSIKNCGEY
jgi:hypothetical protein